MNTFTIGIIREGKVPPDFRVPLTPKQCNEIQTRFPNVKVLVQTSPIRTFKDEEYQKEGIEIVENLKKEFDKRSEIGQEKYGTTLKDNDTDDFLQHLKEELMDAILYIEKLQSIK
mgnify:CR=1 FL=1